MTFYQRPFYTDQEMSTSTFGFNPAPNQQHGNFLNIDNNLANILRSNYNIIPQPPAQYGNSMQFNPNISAMGCPGGYYGNPIPTNYFQNPNALINNAGQSLGNMGCVGNVHGFVNQQPQFLPLQPSAVYNTMYTNPEIIPRESVFNSNGEIHEQTLRKVIPAIANSSNACNPIKDNQQMAAINAHHSQSQVYQSQLASTFHNQPLAQPTGPLSQTLHRNVCLPYQNIWGGMMALHPTGGMGGIGGRDEGPSQQESASHSMCTPVYSLAFLNESQSDKNIQNVLPVPHNNMMPATNILTHSGSFVAPLNTSIQNNAMLDIRSDPNTWTHTAGSNGNTHQICSNRPTKQQSKVNTLDLYDVQNLIEQKLAYKTKAKTLKQKNISNLPKIKTSTANSLGGITQCSRDSYNRDKAVPPLVRRVKSMDETGMLDRQGAVSFQEYMKTAAGKEGGNPLNEQKWGTLGNDSSSVNIRKASYGIVRENKNAYDSLPPFVNNNLSKRLPQDAGVPGESFQSDATHPTYQLPLQPSVGDILESLKSQSNSNNAGIFKNQPRPISLENDYSNRSNSPLPVSNLSREEWWRTLPVDKLNHSTSCEQKSPPPPPRNPLITPKPTKSNQEIISYLFSRDRILRQNSEPARPSQAVSGSTIADIVNNLYPTSSKSTDSKLNKADKSQNTKQSNSSTTVRRSPKPITKTQNKTQNETQNKNSLASERSTSERIDDISDIIVPPDHQDMAIQVRSSCKEVELDTKAPRKSERFVEESKGCFPTNRSSDHRRPDRGSRNDRGMSTSSKSTREAAGCRGRTRYQPSDGRLQQTRNVEGGDRGVMTIEDKLRSFISVLKRSTAKSNCIQTVENCLTSARTGLKSEYQVEVYQPKGNKPTFHGTLSLSGVFIAWASGLSKKTLKHKVYEKAVEVLTTKTVDDILAMGEDGGHAENKDSTGTHSGSQQSAASTLKKKLRLLQDWLRHNRKEDTNPILHLQTAFAESQCNLTYTFLKIPIYDVRGARLFHKCQLRVEGKFMSSFIAFGWREAKGRVAENVIKDLLTLDAHVIYQNLTDEAKPIEDEIRQIRETNSEKTRLDPAMLLDVLISKLREHYSNTDDNNCDDNADDEIDDDDDDEVVDDATSVTAREEGGGLMREEERMTMKNYRNNDDGNVNDDDKSLNDDANDNSKIGFLDGDKNGDDEIPIPLNTSPGEEDGAAIGVNENEKNTSFAPANDKSGNDLANNVNGHSGKMARDGDEDFGDDEENDKGNDDIGPCDGGIDKNNYDIGDDCDGCVDDDVAVAKDESDDDNDDGGDGSVGDCDDRSRLRNQTHQDVVLISKLCIQLRIKLTTVFRKTSPWVDVDSPPHVICQVFVAERLLADVKDVSRRDAQNEAFKVVRQELLGMESGSDVLDIFPALIPEDLKGDDIIDVVYKGYTKVTESNRCRLQRFKRSSKGKKRDAGDIILLEHEDWSADRFAHANCILTQSASMSGLLLEWTCEEDYGVWRCQLILQGVEIARCVARTKKDALTLASLKALYRLYETQPIVKGFHAKSYSSTWVTREQLHKRVRATVPLETVVNMDCGLTRNDVNKYGLSPDVEKAIEGLVSEFFHQPTLREFVTAPDWTPAERKYLRHVSKIHDLRCVTEDKGQGDIVILALRLELSQYVSILRDQPNQAQGRYRLLHDSERPSMNDVAGEIAVNESFVSGIHSHPVKSWLSRSKGRRNRKGQGHSQGQGKSNTRRRSGGRGRGDDTKKGDEWDRSGEYVTANNSLVEVDENDNEREDDDDDDDDVFDIGNVPAVELNNGDNIVMGALGGMDGGGPKDGNEEATAEAVAEAVPKDAVIEDVLILDGKMNDSKESKDGEKDGRCMNAVFPAIRRLLRPLSTSTPDKDGKKKEGREGGRPRAQSESFVAVV